MEDERDVDRQVFLVEHPARLCARESCAITSLNSTERPFHPSGQLGDAL